MEQSNVIDITPDNFQQVIIEESKTKLIVIGFWTAREQACVDIMNEVEALLTPHPQAVSLLKSMLILKPKLRCSLGFKVCRPWRYFMTVNQ